jgi:DNA processing protein
MTQSPLDERTAWLVLNQLLGLGDRGVHQLVDGLGSPLAAVQAAPGDWHRVLGTARGRCVHALPEARERTREQLAAARRRGATLVTLADSSYPQLLRQVAHPPGVLFVLGALAADAAAVAIVGSRRAGAYGLEVAGQLAGELAARGITVVSGMARGIDAAAHRGALAAGGRTVAVLGSGVDVVYPAAHRRLHDQICAQGAVVSQFAMGARPEPGSFPRRNAVVSGLSMAVVVVEAPERSGALITAGCAGEQGRGVMAVPGSILGDRHCGCHALLRDGAVLVQGVDDILSELTGWNLWEDSAPEAPVVTAAPLDSVQRRVMEALEPDPLHIDALAAAAALPAGDMLGILLTLELSGHARQWPGQRFARRIRLSH